MVQLLSKLKKRDYVVWSRFYTTITQLTRPDVEWGKNYKNRQFSGFSNFIGTSVRFFKKLIILALISFSGIVEAS